MRTLVLCLSMLFVSVAYGHNYYFAFAEVAYNDVTQKFEATLTVSTHDLEKSLRESSVIDKELDPETATATDLSLIQIYLAGHFNIFTDGKSPVLKLIGFEVFNNGTSNFYLESEPTSIAGTTIFHFDLLMDDFEDQQNKVTFLYRDKSYTLTFLLNERKQVLKLENE